MSKRTIFFPLLTALFLTACTLTCDPGSLAQPDLVSPNWREVVDGTNAVLEWSYPDTCNPENFEIILSKDRDYSVIEFTELVPGNSTTWTAPTLDIADQYWWRVRAKVGSSYGGYSGERRSFFTLPYCNSSQLVAPSLVSPDFGAIYDNDYDSLEWGWPLYGTCIPESYRVEVSPDTPAFTDTTYNGATGSPGTRWGFGSTPPPATQFWWRVSAYADGTWGPTPNHKMFWTAPACTAASLIQPIQETPLEDEIDTLPHLILTWSYPDPSCVPEGAHHWISDKADMSSIVFDSNVPNIASVAMIVQPDLDDCKEYYWQMAMISEGLEGPPSPIRRFVIDRGGLCSCTETSLPIPDMVSPPYFEVFPDTNVMIQWENPGGCFEDGSSVKLAADPFYEDSSLDQYFSGGFITGYNPPSLEPATQYWTKVAFAVEDGGDPYIGDYSSTRAFLTGPECTSLAEAMAPVQDLPEDEVVVDTLTPLLRYHPGEPACIPDGYFINLQDDPTFSGISLLGAYPQPSTAVITEPLEDCTTYYWKVSATQSGGSGPESPVRSFFVNETGVCLPPGVPGVAKTNHYCREGTYPDFFPALWTIEKGDRVLAIARNFQTTYLKLNILNQESLEPFEQEIQCWSYVDNFEPGWPEIIAGMTFSFRDLPVEDPPEPPACHENLTFQECVEADGHYDEKLKICRCP